MTNSAIQHSGDDYGFLSTGTWALERYLEELNNAEGLFSAGFCREEFSLTQNFAPVQAGPVRSSKVTGLFASVEEELASL